MKAKDKIQLDRILDRLRYDIVELAALAATNITMYNELQRAVRLKLPEKEAETIIHAAMLSAVDTSIKERKEVTGDDD